MKDRFANLIFGRSCSITSLSMKIGGVEPQLAKSATYLISSTRKLERCAKNSLSEPLSGAPSQW